MKYSAPSQGYNQSELIEANPVGVFYNAKLEQSREDVCRNLPLKQIEWIVAEWGGPHGFTYRHSGKEGLNELLKQDPDMKEETDYHERDHCESERNTRYISRSRTERTSLESFARELLIKQNYNYN